DVLILDLLNYGRIGHVSLPCGWEELETILGAVLAEFSEQLQTTGAQVEVLRPLPKVWCNGTLLKQVLANLLNNALKYVHAGVTPRIKVWAEDSETACSIFVQDNGIGIKPEHQERIFKVFERLHREEEYPGTGMGLAIVQKGVQRM